MENQQLPPAPLLSCASMDDSWKLHRLRLWPWNQKRCRWLSSRTSWLRWNM